MGISSTNYLSVRQLPLQDSGLMIWELTIIIGFPFTDPN